MGPSTHGAASFRLLSNGDGKDMPTAQTGTSADLVSISPADLLTDPSSLQACRELWASRLPCVQALLALPGLRRGLQNMEAATISFCVKDPKTTWGRGAESPLHGGHTRCRCHWPEAPTALPKDTRLSFILGSLVRRGCHVCSGTYEQRSEHQGRTHGTQSGHTPGLSFRTGGKKT